jgi:lysophospholipase L1-like esterase
MGRRSRRIATALAALAGVAGLVAVAGPGVASARTTSPRYYVSLGDSYAVGYQPGMGATTGYTGYVAAKTHFTLVNFGCGGATTTSIIATKGCPDVLPHTAGVRTYPTTTQLAAAEGFIRAHRAHVALITVSIGGNDVTSCASQASPIPCVGSAVANITKNVTVLATGLRAAAGPSVPIIGLTYPDVILGSYVYPKHPPTPAAINLANLSVTAFKTLINPALAKAYGAVYGALIDVTAATGAYTLLSDMTTLKPYGTIPVAVAKVCTLTWFCKEGNIHATSKGYALIGQLIVAKYDTIHHG